MRSIVNNVPSCAIPCNNCRHCQVLFENGCEMHISRLTWKQPHFWKHNWGWSRKHGLGRWACVLLVLLAPPQKPHFFTTLGWQCLIPILKLDCKPPHCCWRFWGLASKHGIERLAWVHLELLAQPQKPRFHKSLGVGMMIPILRLECSPYEYDAGIRDMLACGLFWVRYVACILQ